MILFISCSKTMTEHSRIKVPFTSLPIFETKAKEIALDMVHYSASELAQLFYTKNSLRLKTLTMHNNICLFLLSCMACCAR